MHRPRGVNGLFGGTHRSGNERVREWEGETEAVPYLGAAVFSRHIVDRYESGDTSTYSEGFDVIEQLIVEGSEDVRGLATVGILEGIQNIASWTPFGPEVFRKWLGARSKEAWDELNIVWKGKNNLADVVRAESDAD